MDRRYSSLLYVGMIAGTLICAGLVAYPFVDPLKSMSLARALILRGTLFVSGVFGLVAALVIIDVVTPGDWLDRVGNDALSSAILLSAVVAGLAWMYCYA